MTTQLITQEGFTSVQEVQSGVTKVFKRAAKQGKFLRVMRNQKPLGVLVPNQVWNDIVEDHQLQLNQQTIDQIDAADQDLVTHSPEETKKLLNSNQ